MKKWMQLSIICNLEYILCCINTPLFWRKNLRERTFMYELFFNRFHIINYQLVATWHLAYSWNLMFYRSSIKKNVPKIQCNKQIWKINSGKKFLAKVYRSFSTFLTLEKDAGACLPATCEDIHRTLRPTVPTCGGGSAGKPRDARAEFCHKHQ